MESLSAANMTDASRNGSCPNGERFTKKASNLTAPRSVALALLSELAFALALLPSPRRPLGRLVQHKGSDLWRH
jgi:hypothetical protein